MPFATDVLAAAALPSLLTISQLDGYVAAGSKIEVGTTKVTITNEVVALYLAPRTLRKNGNANATAWLNKFHGVIAVSPVRPAPPVVPDAVKAEAKRVRLIHQERRADAAIYRKAQYKAGTPVSYDESLAKFNTFRARG